jgi:hypothetical protein
VPDEIEILKNAPLHDEENAPVSSSQSVSMQRVDTSPRREAEHMPAPDLICNSIEVPANWAQGIAADFQVGIRQACGEDGIARQSHHVVVGRQSAKGDAGEMAGDETRPADRR